MVDEEVSVWIGAPEEVLENIECIAFETVTSNQFFVVCFGVFVERWNTIFEASFSMLVVTFLPGCVRENIICFTDCIEVALADS